MQVTREVVARIPVTYGVFDVALYSNTQDQKEHLALVYGGIENVKHEKKMCVRVHSECFTGEVLGSLRCDCGEQLITAMAHMSSIGIGVVIFMRQEGRGIGLKQKLRAYNLQDEGYDTVEANLMLGHKADERNYEIAGLILEDLKVQDVQLLTNNPTKIDALLKCGINVVGRLPMEPKQISPDTLRYLTTKVQRMHHNLSLNDLSVNVSMSVASAPITRSPSVSGSEDELKKNIQHKHNHRSSCDVLSESLFEGLSKYRKTDDITTNTANLSEGIGNGINDEDDDDDDDSSGICILETPPSKPSLNSSNNQDSKNITTFTNESSTNCHVNRPFITLTYAQSLDGSIATKEKKPLIISGKSSMTMTHKLRSYHQGILVGIGTVLSDNPRLTVRLVEGKNPRPVILDSNLQTPLDCHLMERGRNPLIFCSLDADKDKKEILESGGAEVICIKKTDGILDISEVTQQIKNMNIISLMVEGGASVIESFLQSKLVDKCIVTIAPVYIDGFRALSSEKKKVNLPRLMHVKTQQLDDDIILTGKPVWAETTKI